MTCPPFPSVISSARGVSWREDKFAAQASAVAGGGQRNRRGIAELEHAAVTGHINRGVHQHAASLRHGYGRLVDLRWA